MATDNIRVSVVIPHLNQPDALKACIRSLEAQTFPVSTVEVIVVDNGSRSLPEVSSDCFARFQLLEEVTPGPGPARNRGVAASVGEYLFFIDADCTAHKDWVSQGIKAFRYLDAGDNQILGGEVYTCQEDVESFSPLDAYETLFAFRQKMYVEKMKFSATLNLATKRSLFDKTGPFGGISIAEDRDWCWRAIEQGARIDFAPEMIVIHPARSGYSEIFEKWQRQIRHDLNQKLDEKAMWRFKWLGETLLVLVSIPVHCVAALLSKKLHRLRDRFKACRALVKIRLYRVSLMLKLLVSSKARDANIEWNSREL